MKRSLHLSVLAGLLLLIWLDVPAVATVVVQRTHDNFVAFEAEHAQTLGGNNWRIVDLITPYPHPNTSPKVPVTPYLLPPTTNASGGAALLHDFYQGTSSIAVYELHFSTAGTYRWYIRDGAFEDGRAAGYGNEDSLHRPETFNADPNTVYHGYSGQTEGQYGWRNTGMSYVVDAPGMVEFRIRPRESGFSIDRMVFSTRTNLGSSALDALWNSGVNVTHFTDGGSDSDWSTAANWDGGVPDSLKSAYLGGGNAATLGAAGAEAYQLTIGHVEATLPGDGTLNQSAGDLTIANGLFIGINPSGDSHMAGTYTATGGSTLTVGQPATGRAGLYLGYNTAGTDYDATGTLDLSGAAQFDAYLANLVLGEVTSSAARGRAAGILKLAETNSIDATQIVVSTSAMHRQSQSLSIVELGETNNIQADLLVVGGRRSRATLEFAAPGGTLNLTGSSDTAADLRVAYTDLSTGSSGNATMDLTGGTFNATLNDVVVAYHMSKGGTDTGTLTFDAGTGTAESLTVGWADSHTSNGKGKAVGTVNMAGGDFSTTTAVFGTGEGTATGTFNLSGGTFTSGSLALGHGLVHADTGDGTGTGTVNISGGTTQINGSAALGTGTAASSGRVTMTGGVMDVTGDVTGGVGSSSISVDGGELDVAGDLMVDSLRVGFNGRTATASVGGDVVVDAPGDLYVGYRNSTTVNPSDSTQGTLNLADANSVILDTSTIGIGILTASLNSRTEGTLTLSTEGVNSITATTITIGNSTSGPTPTVEGTLVLGEDNTIQTDTLYVGRRKARGELNIAAGGTLDLAGPSGAKANLYIGYCDTTTTSTINRGTMNLVGGTLDAALGELVIGYHRYPWSNPTSGRGMGTLSLDAGSVTADTVTIGAGSSDYNEQYGFREGRGVGTLNMGGGTFETQSITLAEGSSRTEGTINLTGGTLTVAGSVVGGIGTSTLNVDGGTMTVGGDLIVDTLRVGAGALVGELTVSGGGTVEIGSETNRTNLYIARTTTDMTNNPKSTVDFSEAGQFTAYLDKFAVGERAGGQTSTFGKPIAEVILAPTTLIDAASVLISQYDVWGANAQQTRLRLGADTTLKTDLLTVAGSRGNALVGFIADGTFKLEGSTGAAADLRVGYCTLGTTNATTGSLDLNGGTFDATVDNLVVGYRVYRGGADVTTTGTMSFDAGTVTANTVTLGWGTQRTNHDGTMGIGIGTLNMGGGSLTADTVRLGFGTSKSEGTINLSGGTLAADSISGGAGTATFNWTGGRLSVDSFGFDLLQTSTAGPSTLAPGNSPGMTTIYGNYTMDAGTLEIDIAGPGDHDFVMVHGNASLTGDLNVLLDDYFPDLGTHFDVLRTTGALDIEGLTLTGDLPSLTFGWWDMGSVPNADGFLLRLSAVPEPTGALLALLALAGLLGCVRPRRAGR